ncbi:MAG: hypothetical protein GX276_04435, partial [Clostridiaceae bacterium]|nr:hypothetical protein [Clostridiaceae bacterium]
YFGRNTPHEAACKVHNDKEETIGQRLARLRRESGMPYVFGSGRHWASRFFHRTLVKMHGVFGVHHAAITTQFKMMSIKNTHVHPAGE